MVSFEMKQTFKKHSRFQGHKSETIRYMGLKKQSGDW